MNFIEDFAETIKNIQGFQPDLFAGATETELKAAEEKMNIMLPEDFKKFYRGFNGQNEYADALFDTFFLCSLKQLLYFWDAFKFNEEDFLQIPAEAEPGIKNVWGCALWVPFAATADGHCLCLDFEPAEGGNAGQVITFWYNSPERELVAPSFKAFIVDFVANIKNGTYVYTKEIYDDITLGMIARKDGKPMFGVE